MPNILLVEDDFELAMHLTAALEKVGLRIIHEASAEAAIEVLGDTPIDVVITDMVIRETDGEMNRAGGLLVVAYIALQKENAPSLIAVSGAEWQSEHSSAFRTLQSFDPERILRKPVSAEQLVARTQELLLEREAAKKQRELHAKLQRDLLCAQTSLDTSKEAIYWIASDGSVRYANDAACKLLGMDREELLSKSVVDIHDGIAELEQFKTHWLPMIKEREGQLLESRLRRRNGAFVITEISANLIDFDDDQFVSISARDISQRKREEQQILEAKRAAEESERRFRTLADSAPTLVWTTDLDSQCTWLNRRWLDYSGKSLDDSVGHGWIETVHPDDRETTFQIYLSALEAETNFSLGYRLLRHDGVYRWHTVTAAPRYDDSKQCVGYIGMSFNDHDARESRVALEQSEARLREVNESYRAMVDLLGTSDGVWDWIPGTEGASYAPGFRKILGFSGDDIEGFPDQLSSFLDRVHQDDKDALWRCFEESLATRKPLTHEYRIRCKDESYIWVRSRGSTSYDDSGKPVRMVGSTYDITDQKHAERERDLFFNTAVNFSLIAEVGTGRWLKPSENWTELLGYSIDELCEMSLYDLAHPDDFETIRSTLSELVKTERAHAELPQSELPQSTTASLKLNRGTETRELVVRLLDIRGETHWLEFHISESQDDSRMFYATARDVTEIDTSLFQAMTRVIPQALYIFDLEEKKIVLENHATGHNIGYANSFADNADVEMARVHAGDLAKVQSHLKRLRQAEDGLTLQVDYRVQTRGEQWQRILSRDSVFKRSADGAVQQIIGTATNLDELEILKRYAADLEFANRELEQFAYIASHDLKQPLRGIDNLAKWIQEDAADVLPSESKVHLDLLSQRVRRMEKLLDDLLEYSRIGRGQCESEPVDIKTLVGEVFEIMNPLGQMKTHYVGDDFTLLTPRIELEQVLRNLVGNAIKHHPRKDGSVTVYVAFDEPWLSISVEDDGNGIPTQFHDRVFRMFHTLKTRDEVEGSGMGLAIVRKIVESRGGKVTLDSPEGQGAKFCFSWPGMNCTSP